VGAGIRLSKLSEDYMEAETSMKLRWYNKNLVGTHFGGSIFSMTDPFYMIMLVYHIGDKHYVWDKTSTIEFLKPGKSELRAHFKLTPALLDEIVKKADDGKPHYSSFDVKVLDQDDGVVAKINKTLYVRRKSPKKDSDMEE